MREMTACRRGARAIAVRALAAGAVAAGGVALLSGCGGSSGSATTSAAVPSSPAVAAAGQSGGHKVDAVAFVSGTPIDKSSYGHWLAVERALGGNTNPGHRALGFLITSDWVLGEAGARKVSVSDAEVKRRFGQLIKQSFPKAGSLQKFLASSGQTEADLLARVRVELLTSRIAAQVATGKSSAQRQAALTSFQRTFVAHWKRYTTCEAGYVMEYCSEYHGKPENLAAASSRSSHGSGTANGSVSASGSSSSRPSGSASSSSTGEVSSPPGSFAVTSPAFERNGQIPARYTCDGANVSPPLEWQNAPAKAAAFVLFAIDDSSTGPASGIRWVVGDIDPSVHSVAAGATPAGGIVGSDTQGHAGYGGICPPHGKTSTIEFVVYALKRKIPLSPGFQPAVAEREYGAGKLLLGSAAVNYAVYHRP